MVGYGALENHYRFISFIPLSYVLISKMVSVLAHAIFLYVAYQLIAAGIKENLYGETA